MSRVTWRYSPERLGWDRIEDGVTTFVTRREAASTVFDWVLDDCRQKKYTPPAENEIVDEPDLGSIIAGAVRGK